MSGTLLLLLTCLLVQIATVTPNRGNGLVHDNNPASTLCRVGDELDFSLTGSVKFATTKNTAMEISVCRPSSDGCPNLTPGFVQVVPSGLQSESGGCASNATDTFPEIDSIELSANGATFTYANSAGASISVSVICDEHGPINIVSKTLEPFDGKTITLSSRCACAGGCGVPPEAPPDNECAINDVKLSSMLPVTFNTVTQGASQLWLLSACGPSGALCNQNPAYLSTQDDTSTCDKEHLYTSLVSVASIPKGVPTPPAVVGRGQGGVMLTYGGSGVGLATVLVFCDPYVDMLQAKPLSARAIASGGYGAMSRWNYNFSSRCACPNGCPQKRDYWALGPGQQTTHVVATVDYPGGYPGRVKNAQPNGATFIGKAVSEDVCRGACDFIPQECSAFSYSQRENGTCLLFANASCAAETSPGWNVTTFWRTSVCSPRTIRLHHDPTAKKSTSSRLRRSGAAPSCNERPGECYSATGAIGKVTNISDSATCCQMCGADPSCAAYTLLQNASATCILLHTPSGTTTKDPACTSGSTTAPPPPSPSAPPTAPPWVPDNCSVAGMHFGQLTGVKIELPYAGSLFPALQSFSDDDAVPTPTAQSQLQVSLCRPLSLCAQDKSTAPYFRWYHDWTQASCSTPADMTFGKLENFSTGDAGADFLFSAPSFLKYPKLTAGYALVHVACDRQAAMAWTLSAAPESIVIDNSTATNAYVTVQMVSKCACPGACGPPPPVVNHRTCHVDAKNFSATAPAVFSLPVNLTTGWSNGVPKASTPLGFQGTQVFTWSVSPCAAKSTVCASNAYMMTRANNASWCASNADGAVAAMTELQYYSARKDFVEFALASADAKQVAIVGVSCGASVTAEAFVASSAMYMVEAVEQNDQIVFQVNLTSQCACDGMCVPHPSRPYHSQGPGMTAASQGTPIEYPTSAPGHSIFNGSSCGRGVTVEVCEEVCDSVAAQNQPDSNCDSFEFTEGSGLCFLYQKGTCGTYDNGATTTYWVNDVCPTVMLGNQQR
eukprot:m.924327 g.924327  ORF g.924327 m.924327 type:complete len:1006 (+) comp23768_c0_seq5:93-3110(+)